MKKIITHIAFYLITAAFLTACSLDEQNYSSLTSQDYFTGDVEYDQLVSEAYVMMRPLLRVTVPMWYGTDLYECTGNHKLSDARTPTNDYTIMGGDEYLDFWQASYDLISKVNTALTRGNTMGDVSESLRNKRTAELLALRAYSYFNLVENFGGVPLLTEEILSPIYNFTRNTEEEVYNQIVTDLTEALKMLPSQPEEFGRVSKGFANHLLAKVYLTRSYKSFGNKNDDLNKTISYAREALTAHPLLTSNAWDILFDTYTKKTYQPNSSEVIFSVRYSNSTDQTYNGKWGNNLYQHFKFWIDQFPGKSTTAGPYWRPDGTYQPTSLYFSLFDNNDVRGSETFLQRNIIAAGNDDEAGNNGKIEKGDVVVYFPSTPMSETEKEAYKTAHQPLCYVVNPDEYHDYIHGTYTAYPLVWKFYDPYITKYTSDQQNPEGSRDTYVFRSAESLLLMAEAYVQQGNGGEATQLINQLRSRAGAVLLTGNATIDDVLDESARELFGEANRWMDLKRTGKLFERAYKYNVWIQKQHASAGNISDNYLLRPIPITEIARSNGTLTQNSGFPGGK